MISNETLLITIPFDAFPDSYAKLQELQPGLQIHHFNTAGVDIVAPEIWAKTTVHLTHSLFAKSREQAPQLKWVHLYSGGINQALAAPLLHDKSIIWTRNSGVHAPQIAEWAISMLLSHYRQVPLLVKWQESGLWQAGEYRPRGDLLGKTIAFLGYGAIARHTARIAAACGMRVLAYTLHEKATTEQKKSATFTLPHTGDPDGELPAEWHHGDLDAFLSSSQIDVLVISLPSTDKTRQSIAQKQFAQLEGCYVINLARGDIINTDDLVAALNDGTLRGAALDVTDPEPLPERHPLWTARNATVTPHISGVSDDYMPRTVLILNENLTRLHAGREMVNLILRSDGY